MTMLGLHCSSQASREPSTLLTAVEGWIERHEPDRISLTEIMREARARVLTDIDGWSLTRPRGTDGRDECGLLTLDSKWLVTSYRAVQLSPHGIPRRGGKFAFALVVVLVDLETRQRHTEIIVHLPSGVEGTGHLKPGPQTDVYRECIAGLQALVKTIQGPLEVKGDWNLDIRKQWVARYFVNHFPGFAISPPDRGTHGTRAIDFSICRGIKPGPARVVSPLGSSDHRAVLQPLEVQMSGFYPGAKLLNIPPGSNDPRIKPRIAILHVDAGNNESLHGYFDGPSGGIESHFHVRKDGVVEQYRSIYWQADANLKANDFAVSIETQGFGAGQWNAAQLAAIKKLLLWLNKEAGIPLIRCTAWDGRGVGYHVQFGAPGPWTPVAKSCPGPDRVKQYWNVILPWMRSVTNPPKPTRIQQARVLLQAALDRAKARGAIKRATKIQDALDILPQR